MADLKNRVKRICTIVLFLCVLVGEILSNVPQLIYANESFNGIGSIVSSHGTEDPYTILEIVPDLKLGKLGYLVENGKAYYNSRTGELDTFEGALSACDNATKRTDYINALKTQLSGIYRDSSNPTALVPLTYTQYEESYVEVDEYNKLLLHNDESEVFSAQPNSPLTMVADSEGDYSIETTYTVNTSGTGSHNANVAYYSVSTDQMDLENYYNVCFEYTNNHSSGGYQPMNGGRALTTQDEFDSSEKAYLYYSDSSGILRGKRRDLASFTDTDANGQRITYLEITFEYKSASELDDGSIVYWPTESVFCPSQNGEYSARLVEGEPYVSAPGNDGYFDQANDAYRYVGSGNGSFSISETTGVLDHDLVIGCIYYKGGFTSNNYLYQYVFNQSGLLDQEVNSDFAIDVITVTPSQFGSYNLDDVDMIYISGSSALYSGVSTPYSNTNDLTAEQANSIYEAVIGNRFLPVILDYGVCGATSTNISVLAKLLCADNLSSDNKEYSSGTLSVTGTWSEFLDADHHYVNYNVYVVPQDDGYNLLAKFVSPYLVEETDETVFVTNAENAGFGTVASMINMENLYRETENAALGSDIYGYFDLVINPAINIEYIASYSAKREQYSNNTIRVLDIEPCSIGATSKRQIEDKIKGYFGTTEYIFEFTHMTSAQFISKVEDLCNYDMIYMGLYTDTMNTNSGTKRTVYNDSNMNGLVYTNIGDRQYDGVAAGAMDNDYYRAATNRETNNWLQSSGDGNHDVRYSGNDLTEEKQKALITFAKSGCPVILADNFLITDDSGTHVYDFKYDASHHVISVNGYDNGYIDNCSRMYETIDTIKDYNNVMTEASLTTPSTASSQKEILYSFINLGKPRLKMTTATPVANQYYVATNGRNISMDLQLSNFGSADANATFDCVVYIDYNSDGRFSDTMERLGPNDYGIFLNGVQQEVKSRRNGEGEVEYYYELSPNKSGEQYTLSFNVSSDYYGIIPVKVKVTQSSNPYRYDSKQAYFYRSNTTGTKEPIKVLQILSTSGDYSVNAVGNQQKPFDMDITAINDDPYQGNDVDPYKYFSSGSYPENKNNLTNRNNYNVVKSRLTQFSGSPFNTLLHSSEDMKDFEIDVDSITGDHFCQYVVYGYPNANQTAANPNNKLNLDDYDMLILGFGDSWTFFPEDETLQQQAYAEIHEFIKVGKSVLFTHDTTSFGSNYYRKIDSYFTGDWATSDWAYYLNPLMCPDVGLDRYGIYNSNILQAGIDGITKDSSAMVTISDYYSLKKAADSGEIPSDKIVNGQISQGDLYDLVIEQAKKTQSDIAYEPNSNKQVLTREVQGRSNFNSNNHRTYTYASSKTMDINGKPGTDQIATGFHETSYAELLNVGQVLIYPYNLMSSMTNKIGNTTVVGGQFLKISRTHSQYYQIDMNNDDDEDGESDITVWLTLTGEDSYYGARNDSRNNYYIYTMGNVTYSGVGHRNINYTGNEAEIKLYINTMITAYRAGIHAPDITIKQDSGMNAATLNTLYVGMDTLLNDDGRIGTETAIDGSDGSYEKVYFAVNDTNMVRGGSKTIELSYYLAYNSYEMIPENLRSSAKNLGTAENPDWVVPYDFRTYLKDGVTLNNSASDEKFVVSGATYCIHVPYSLVEATNDYSAIVRVGATTRLYPKGSTTASAEYTGYKDFHIQRVSLFDLD